MRLNIVTNFFYSVVVILKGHGKPEEKNKFEGGSSQWIIYRIQELAYGGLTKSTIDRLEALAEGKSIQQRRSDVGRLAVGTRLVREVKGVEHHVYVLADGYEYQGLKYKSLSGVAFAITNTRWNGNAFFGLGKKEDKEKHPYHRPRKARA